MCNKRQYNKYTVSCYGFRIVAGPRLIKKHKYIYKQMHELYKQKRLIKKGQSDEPSQVCLY